MPDIIDWPTALRPGTVDWPVPVVPQRGGRSAFDGSVQAQLLGAPRWTFEVSTGVMKLDEAPQWEALVQRLRGRVNRVRAWDWRREQPLTKAPGALGSPTVRVDATGNTVQTQGWTPSITGILLAGSRFSVNGELKSLSVDADSDSSGRATLSFEPPLRATAPAGGALVLVKPTALFILTTDKPSSAQQGARMLGMSLAFEEVFA